MANYSIELKKKVVDYYLTGKVSFRDTAGKFHVERGAVIKWVAAYRSHGLDGLIVKNETYTGEFKISVLKYMQDTGLSARSAAAHFNIPSYTTICRWERIYIEEGLDALFINRRGRPHIMTDEKILKNGNTPQHLLSSEEKNEATR